MEKFDSGKWIKAFKAHAIVEKDESIKLKDLLHTDKIDDQEYDGKSFQPKLDKSPKAKTGEENDLAIEKDKDGRDVYAVGLTEDYSTMKLKSNIDQKWDDINDMEEDIAAWFDASVAAGGQELGQEIIDRLEHSIIARLEKINGAQDR